MNPFSLLSCKAPRFRFLPRAAGRARRAARSGGEERRSGAERTPPSPIALTHPTTKHTHTHAGTTTSTRGHGGGEDWGTRVDGCSCSACCEPALDPLVTHRSLSTSSAHACLHPSKLSQAHHSNLSYTRHSLLTPSPNRCSSHVDRRPADEADGRGGEAQQQDRTRTCIAVHQGQIARAVRRGA